MVTRSNREGETPQQNDGQQYNSKKTVQKQCTVATDQIQKIYLNAKKKKEKGYRYMEIFVGKHHIYNIEMFK